MGKYAESRKRREKRRKLAKRWYSLCIRDVILHYDYAWVHDMNLKSKNSLIQVLIRFMNDESTRRIMETRAIVVINTWYFTERMRIVNMESLRLVKEKTIEEHIKDYIFEQRCMIRCKLPVELVRMLYEFL
jgi:hypothetical protein